MALSWCQPYLPRTGPLPSPVGGAGGEGEGSSTQYRQEHGAERVGVKAPIRRPATPAAPQPRLPCTATGRVPGLPRSAATTAARVPALPPHPPTPVAAGTSP